MTDIISDKSNIAIEIEHLYNRFGTHSVHEDLNMTVKKGELVALVGGSGSGKTTLLRAIIMLLKPHSGQIYMMGEPVWGNQRAATNGFKKALWDVVSKRGAFQLIDSLRKCNGANEGTFIIIDCRNERVGRA